MISRPGPTPAQGVIVKFEISPNFPHFFLGCVQITTVFSHAQTVVVCASCSTVLCQPTGGRARLTEGIFSIQF